MRDQSRVLRLLIVLLVAWIILDFGLTIGGAFDFNTDESLVWSRTAAAPSPALPGFASTSRFPARQTTVRLLPRVSPAFAATPPHAVPRSRLAAAPDAAGAADDH
jgi:hypothetical protein